MTWTVLLHDGYSSEFDEFAPEVQDELPALMGVLKQLDPSLGRPRLDTLNGSKHANMKELRFDADKCVWWVAFAFDPQHRAILLVGGDKSGGGEKRFYRQLIRIADRRFSDHVAEVKKGRK